MQRHKAIFVFLTFLFICVKAHSVEVMTEIESGKNIEVVEWLQGNQHLRLKLKKDIPNHWFLFALRDVKGKSLTIDIVGQNNTHGDFPWKGVQPMMSETVDLSEPLLYDEATFSKAYNRLPWKRLTDSVYDEKTRTMRIKAKFESDEATIVLKAPCPVSYVERRLAQLKETNKDFEVITAGESMGERPLRVFAIPKLHGGNDRTHRWKEKPVILIYGGEHATEHDSSQVVMGAFEWLLGDSAEAVAMREACNVLLIPHLSPDDTANSVFGRISDGFVGGETYNSDEENVTWAKFWNQWIEEGYPLDVSISIHNVAGAESPNFFSPLFQGYTGSPDYPLSQALHKSVMARVVTKDLRVDRKMGEGGNFNMRLMGWQGFSFETRGAFYEVNSQYPANRLSLTRLRSLGVGVLRGASDFIIEPENFRKQRELQRQRLVRRSQDKATGIADYLEDAQEGTTLADFQDAEWFVFNSAW